MSAQHSDSTETGETFDYVIVGGGTAGCVLANRLTADPKIKVLLLEAGGNGRGFYVGIPLTLGLVIGNPKHDWRYKSEPEPHLNGREMPLPRGLGLGGSTVINGMVYVRGHAYDYDSWAAQGNRGWSWKDVLPYFKKSEAFHSGGNEFHGGNGEWGISDPGVRWEILEAYRKAAIDRGIPATDDYNSGENEGVAYFVANIRKGVRQTAERAFLRPAAERPNLKILTGCLVDNVILTGNRASGVRYTRNAQSFTVQAGREVILAAGAFGSPALLERSGIGQPERLKALGIEPRHNLPGVGENLQDHWQIRVQHRVHGTKTLNSRAGTKLRRILMGMQYVLTHTGPMSGQPTLLAAFTRVMEDAPAPDVQIHVSAASYDRVGGPMHPFPGITSSVCILRPESRGHVHIDGRDPAAAPHILNNFLAAELDQEIAVRSVGLVRHIAGSRELERFSPEEISPKPDVQSREEILEYARRVVTTVFHPCGTCKMGSDPMAVVDDRLHVYGVAGLRVVDASIMPTLVSGNTAAPTVMIAEKAADLIIEDRRAAMAA